MGLQRSLRRRLWWLLSSSAACVDAIWLAFARGAGLRLNALGLIIGRRIVPQAPVRPHQVWGRDLSVFRYQASRSSPRQASTTNRKFGDAGVHSLTPKRDDQLDAALLAIQLAEQSGVTSAVLHGKRRAASLSAARHLFLLVFDVPCFAPANQLNFHSNENPSFIPKAIVVVFCEVTTKLAR